MLVSMHLVPPTIQGLPVPARALTQLESDAQCLGTPAASTYS